MGTINFLFGVHNHQPVGNFEDVFEIAFNNCYQPFLSILAKFPKVRISMHYSGPLLEWIEKHKNEHFNLLYELVQKKQVELLGGAFYEPILPVIPSADAIGQIAMMSDYIKAKFDYEVQGLWLAERVWEPHVVKTIKLSGIKYTIVDEFHFNCAGIEKNKMFGYYISEYGGETLGVFPIDKELRYAIPFKMPEETINYLRGLSAEYDSKSVSVADDGEKFGLWPGTHQWVYNDRYLESLFGLLSDNDSWIKMLHYNEYFEKYPSMGKIYLPNAAYEELMEWALSPKAQSMYQTIKEEIVRSPHREDYHHYFRGGIWRNFLVKYPESNLMYSKMWHISNKLHTVFKEDGLKAKKALWRGQCNCAYWHGLFGGLYLNYLRDAIYRNILTAESLIDEKLGVVSGEYTAENIDYMHNGNNELLVSSKNMNVYFTPLYGGSIFELDYKVKSFNLMNVLTRKKEFYHNALLDLRHQEEQVTNTPKSIHEISHSKEEGLANILFYDWYKKYSFMDHFISENTDMDNFIKCRYSEEGDFLNQEYELVDCKQKDDKMIVVFRREGQIYRGDEQIYPILLEKSFVIDDKLSTVEVLYSITNNNCASVECWFGTEINLTLLAGKEEQRYYQINGSKKKMLEVKTSEKEVSGINLIDDWQKMAITISWEKANDLWYFPIETVSQSEGGFEKTYQGSTIFPSWKLILKEKETEKIRLTLNIKDLQ